MCKLASPSPPQIGNILLLDILYTKSECLYVHVQVCASPYMYPYIYAHHLRWTELFFCIFYG